MVCASRARSRTAAAVADGAARPRLVPLAGVDGPASRTCVNARQAAPPLPGLWPRRRGGAAADRHFRPTPARLPHPLRLAADRNPHTRIGADEALQHRWLRRALGYTPEFSFSLSSSSSTDTSDWAVSPLGVRAAAPPSS
eukprot:107363-Chlamydomonas_euryale.AAC.5